MDQEASGLPEPFVLVPRYIQGRFHVELDLLACKLPLPTSHSLSAFSLWIFTVWIFMVYHFFLKMIYSRHNKKAHPWNLNTMAILTRPKQWQYQLTCQYRWRQLVTAEGGRIGLFQGSAAPPVSYPFPKSQPWKHTHILNGLNKLYLYTYAYIYTHKTIIIYNNNKEKEIMNLRESWGLEGGEGRNTINSIHMWYLINLLKRKIEFYTCVTKGFFSSLRILVKYF